MIDDMLKNRQHVLEYDTEANIPQSKINSLLERTWKVTPSKNNFMPYNIHVLGPEHEMYKKFVYFICVSNENFMNSKSHVSSINNVNPNYKNILSCSYLLIFTMRLEDQPSVFQQQQINNGIYYEAVDEENLFKLKDTASLEVGLFSNTFTGLCLEEGIDTSFTLCFRRDVEFWQDLPFVKRSPLLLMTVGKGKVYRRDVAIEEGWSNNDLRPNYDRIVKFV
jgi:hypothetical protein